MIVSFFAKSFACIFFLLFIFSNSHASHIYGGNITYTCLGSNVYKVISSGYEGCGSTAGSPQGAFSLTSATCGQQITSIVRTNLTILDVTPLCPSQIPNSVCSGGTLPGIAQYQFEYIVYIPPNCPDWRFFSPDAARIAGLNGGLGNSSQGLLTTLNTVGGNCNSSPVFSRPLVPLICDQEPYCFVPDAIDPDGDSLAFSLIEPFDMNGNPISYGAPFSITNPFLTTSGTILFDSTNGNLCFTPNGIQTGVVAIQVEEYRNGVLVGSVVHDITISVRSCSNQFPSLPGGTLTAVANGILLDSNSISLCSGENLSFQMAFQDADGSDSLAILSNITSQLPGITTSFTGSNPLTVNFSWIPANTDLGTHFFYVEVFDDHCPMIGNRIYFFDIEVLPATLAGPDLNYCPGGGPLPLQVTGAGTSFTWSTLSGDPGGLSCTNCPDPLASPTVTSTYVVETNLVNACANRDTIGIQVVPDFQLSLTPDTTLCGNQYLEIQGSPGPASAGPFSTQWSPTVGLGSPQNNTTTVQVLDTSTYVFSATSTAGCTLRDSLTVNIDGLAPIVRLPSQDTFCPGDTVNLIPLISYNCDTNSSPCSGTLDTISVGELNLFFSGDLSPGYLDSLTPGSFKLQYIFTATELAAQGFNGGQIDQLAMNILAAGDTVKDLQISIGCTPFGSWDSIPGNFLTGLHVVKQAFDLAPVSGWFHWTLDTPFTWDGVSNLVVEFCTQSLNQGVNSDVEISTTSEQTRLGFFFPYLSNACLQPLGIKSTRRPNLRFLSCNATTPSTIFSWSPPTHLSASNLQSPLATPISDFSYQLTVVDDPKCPVSNSIDLVLDTFVTALATAQDSTPCLGQVVQLNGSTNGNPTPNPNSFCGVNPAPCILPDQDYTFTSSLSFGDPSYGPFSSFGSTDTRYQYLYRASELSVLGITSGTFSQIGWNVLQKFSTTPFENFCVKIGCTPETELSPAVGWLPTTLVYGPVDHNTVLGWNIFLLDNPYEWDGLSNLVVEVCYDLPDGGSVADDFNEVSFSYGFNCFLANSSNAPGTSGCNLPPGSIVYPDRPAMRVTHCARSGFAYSWSPPIGLSDPDLQNPILTYGGTDTYVLTVTGGRCPVTDTLQLSECIPLPGEQLRLFGEASDKASLLSWVLEHPEDWHHVQLERSVNGVDYEIIYREDMTESGAADHEYLDDHPNFGPNFYRVRTLNPSGEVALSNVVKLQFERSSGTIALYPNPIDPSGPLTLDFFAQSEGLLRLEWLDIWGRKLGEYAVQLNPGNNRLLLETANFAQGVYFLSLHLGSLHEVKKVIVEGE